MTAPEADPRVNVHRLHDVRPHHGPEAEDGAPMVVPLATITAAALAERDVLERPWLVRDMIPGRNVTLLMGDGGTGKSLLAQQLAAAVAAAGDWIGTVPEAGGVVYVSAEDDIDEVHRRLADITAASGIGLDRLADLHIVPLAGHDAVLALPDRRSDIISPTPLWHSLVATVQQHRPRLVVLDNLADVFAGNEISRPQARQFIGLLRGLAIANDLAVLLLGHPSLTGLSTGTGTSGSTAWSNSVRSRLYLERAKSDGEEPDPNLRILKVMKANYAPTGMEVRLRWEAGALKLDGGGPGMFDRIAAEAKADRVFLKVLTRMAEEGRDVSPNRSASYAPTVFAKQPDGEGCNKAAFEKAMERLLAARKIKIQKHGPPSRTTYRLLQ